jgi:hypothetical protein
MADLKPLGSEKLKADEKLKRILELTYYKDNNNNKSTTSKPEMVSESKNGGVYGIVREKDGYYVKSGLNESSLDYIGGMFMKNKNKFSSYGEAAKRLNLIQGQDELQEATKYVLKQNSPKSEAPAPAPSMDAPAPAPAPAPTTAPTDSIEPSGIPASDEPTDLPPSGGEEEVPGEPKRSDYMAEVQKYAGKLGQELRDLHDRMESDDIKYVLNMIISAVDLDKLDDEDIEEIGKKFERDEETGGEQPSFDDIPAEEPTPTPDKDLGEDANMDALESFINTPSPMMDTDEIDLSSYVGNTNEIDDFSKHADLEMGEETKEVDLDEIKNEIHRSIGETLSKYFN